MQLATLDLERREALAVDIVDCGAHVAQGVDQRRDGPVAHALIAVEGYAAAPLACHEGGEETHRRACPLHINIIITIITMV